jgi:hypothetical protein
MQPDLPPPSGGPMRPAPFGANPYASMSAAPPPQKMHHSSHVPWLLISFIITIILFVGAAGGFVWAFMERGTYKDHSDKKAAEAVTKANKELSDAKDKEFAEKEKNPLKEYKTPAVYGSVSVLYPKTWSAYVAEMPNVPATPIDGYFHPNFVPGLATNTAYALRVEVLGKEYAKALKEFDNDVKAGRVKVAAYQAPKVPTVTGSRIDGEIQKDQKGTVILLPLRDKTISISTHSPQFANDFNSIVLANLTFVP